ncbi:peptide deformylase [Candidatus Gracilibacteria bacterium]|nr:peptide deformylase [Candidatus Gracilibacteria bacterium]
MLQIEIGENNEILRKISKDITRDKFKKYVKIGKEMIKYIKNPDNGGVGLAAPQVGYNKRLIVVSLLKDWEDESFPTVMMINPEILEHSDNIIMCDEGCLSVPGAKGKVPRWESIKLKYFDEKFKENIMLLHGLRADIVQHEIDHLDGILFTDRLKEYEQQKKSLLA